RMCEVDYNRYDFATNHDWYLRCYASTLVHEATHGEIFSRYVIGSVRNRLRIEKLCHSEERRFLRRLDTPDRLWSEQIAGEFDEQYYSRYYSAGWLSKRLGVLRRLREVRRQHNNTSRS